MDIALCASNFSGYGSGILKKSDGCCTSLNHAVTLVGYSLCDDEGNDGEDGDGNDGDNNDGDGDGNDGDDNGPPPACSVDKWWYSC